MKLSKAQTEVMEEAKANIDKTRALSFYEWYRIHFHGNGETDAQIDEEIARDEKAHPFMKGWYHNMYENERNGITLVTANTRTLKKLEEMGLIELVKNGGSYPDHIKVINY
jgi:hypothetical protein